MVKLAYFMQYKKRGLRGFGYFAEGTKMNNKMLGLSTLIDQIKQDLLSQPVSVKDALFQVDEVTVELNFVVSGDIESGFNFGVVSLGSNVDESRVQKITVKLLPLVKYAPQTVPIQTSDSQSLDMKAAKVVRRLRGTSPVFTTEPIAVKTTPVFAHKPKLAILKRSAGRPKLVGLKIKAGGKKG